MLWLLMICLIHHKVWILMKADFSSTWQEFSRHPREESFAPLYEAALPLVYTVCARLTSSVEDAEDACQSAFGRIVREVQSRSIETGLDGKTYVCRTAAREADALKKRQTRRTEREATVKETTFSDNLHDQELHLTVEKILESLPEELRVPVQLHYLHGFTQQEVADTLEIPRTTIASRIKKALGELETKLRAEGITNTTAVFATIAGTAALLQPTNSVSAAAVWSAAGAAGGAAVAGAGLVGLFTDLVEGPATITMEANGYEPGILEINMDDPEHHTGNAHPVTMKKLKLP